ncbi:hypothetical protein AMTRI_Chr11g155340 [Amborella trichopoda]|uniref:NAC domain-containing protein n=1 Tax=Amborella trichopoda TaxID=13333 RepID=W1PF05_AMBTC|nr:NAC domain-containing protein 37 [Amborella trichopoda]XP_020524438.1 NAC domain-containing protein 37 [Amborella trichopoda]XP_020524439.1 NAC domain-containing protein 37 [Amborella trichopoda]ERN08567.1 hypothetical protein AMTR_s00017p00119990 [Amborella trichopoda]|eukprot:XP_020524437.1 NAC domain-containing protein 37 [Amborella trichopoda]
MEMDTMIVPPGFRFHPTEEELVGYYLTKKITSQQIDLDIIRDIDLYRIEPWDLHERCGNLYEEQKEWYFFSYKDRKYPTGTRTNRATLAGFWKATGRDKTIFSKGNKVIGMRKTLVFYQGRAPNGRKSDWIMHEYRLQTTEDAPPQEEGWVVCRAFRKQSSSTKGSTEAWRSINQARIPLLTDVFDLSSQFSDSPPLIPLNEYQNASSCNDGSHLDNMNTPQFLHLPKLESSNSPMQQLQKTDFEPSYTLVEDQENENSSRGKATTWGALDWIFNSLLDQP